MEYTVTGHLHVEVPSVTNEEGYPLQVIIPLNKVTSEVLHSDVFAETIDQDVADAITVIQRETQ